MTLDHSAGTADPHPELRSRIVEALRTTGSQFSAAWRDQDAPWQRHEPDTGGCHSFLATCALCCGDVEALADGILRAVADAAPVAARPLEVWESDADGCPGTWPRTPLCSSAATAQEVALEVYRDPFVDPEEDDHLWEWRQDGRGGYELWQDGQDTGVVVRRVTVHDTADSAAEERTEC